MQHRDPGRPDPGRPSLADLLDVVDVLPGAIAVVSVERGRVLGVSSRLVATLDRSGIDGDPTVALARLSTPAVRDLLVEVARSGRPGRLDAVPVRAGTTERFLDIGARPLSLDGDPSVVIVDLEDASDRIAAEQAAAAARVALEAARTANDKYRLLFEHSQLGVVVHAADGMIVDLNPAALRILGASTLEELLGRDSNDPRWQAVRESGEPFPGPEHPAMVTLRTQEPARSVMGVGRQDTGERRWLRVTASPLRDDAGTFTGVFATFEDITSYWAMQDELARRTAVLDAVLDSTPAGFALLDTERRYVQVNRALAEMNGLTVADHLGRRIDDVIPPLAGRGDDLLGRVLAGETIVGIEMTGTTAAHPGRARTFRVDLHPVSVDARIIGIGITVVDVTEQRRLERERVTLERRRHEAAMLELQRTLDEEVEAVRILQDAVVPDRPGGGDGIDAAARYVVASTAAEVGGDWFDLVPLGSGRFALVVGDVAGHGIVATRTMLELRHWARLLVTRTASPAEVLTDLDRALTRFSPDAMATALVAVLDLAAGSLTWASAGHPPPVLRRAGHARLLPPVRVGPPLGAAPFTGVDQTDTLVRGDACVLYTDGLAERRGEVVDDGLARLVAAVAAAPTGAEELCEHVIATALDGAERRDDACVLAIVTR
jgi:PAS domain S-box-containing protein